MLEIRPCHIREARDYVKEHHRHNIPPVGGKFAVACYDGDRLCGVAIAGRPVSRYVMVYDKPYASYQHKAFQRYVNNKTIFRSCTWDEYDRRR